ncbi:MAG: LysR family transcriptional regulator [Lachnospiraceae bacterium]|nr:LysR family transcriptional regulator [Lachnospiraceae bacterium]
MIRNWELYRVFYHVATASSLTDAAKELQVTQPAVSQSMKQLEHQLDVKLFTRQGKGIRLTREGEILFSHIAKGFDAFSEGERQLHEILDLNDGEIRIGATDYAVKFYLLPHLEQFRTNYPNIKITFPTIQEPSFTGTATQPDFGAELEKGHIDLALCECAYKGREKLIETKLDDIEEIFVAGVGYSYLRSQELPYQLLSHLPLICAPDGSISGSHLRSHLNSLGVRIDPSYTFPDPEMILQFALQNLGVACLPKEYAAPFIENGSLIRLNFIPALPKRPLYLLYRDNTHTSRATAALLSSLGKSTT